MAKVLFESSDREAAHKKQAEFISSGEHELACCTDVVLKKVNAKRTETHPTYVNTLVWDDTPTSSDIDSYLKNKVA